MSNMFSSVFSFLTIIPSGSHTLEDTAKNMHAFPAIGLLMGFVLGMAATDGLYYAGVDQKLLQLQCYLKNWRFACGVAHSMLKNYAADHLWQPAYIIMCQW